MKRWKEQAFLLWGISMLCLLLPFVFCVAAMGIWRSALLFLPAVAVSLVWVLHLWFRRKAAVRLPQTQLSEGTAAILTDLQLPVAMVRPNEELLWWNTAFAEEFLLEDKKGRELMQQLMRLYNADTHQQEQLLEYLGKSYQVYRISSVGEKETIYTFQFTDITEVQQWKLKYIASKPCVMLMVIDNYDDTLQYAKESEKVQVSVEVENILEEFIQGTNGIIRKIENDLFYVVMETSHVRTIMQSKFKVLDAARKINVNGRIRLTFSIGVGFGADTLQESERFAHQSLDMALGRGGDQAAVKTDNGFCFFGGVSKGVEKKSKTRIRSIAAALEELIQDADHVFLMGHRFGDLDAIGSACGLDGAIQMMKKPVSIVVNQKNCLATQLIERMKIAERPPEFISPEEALERVTANSLLIIVDTHNKEILESAELYEACHCTAVIDHHRKNVNYIEDAMLFHHEPYASSASEMVTELIQYFHLHEEIPRANADALLAGITLDTKNFVMRTGVRTFEAAAYLKKIGADTVQVKSLFSSTISMYQMRSQIVAHAEIYQNNAISVAKIASPEMRVIAAQAADELLSIQDVEASYVLFPSNNGVNISARSLGNTNVQLIMEEMGGGGHQTMAAAQISGSTLQEVKERLLQVLEAHGEQKNQ